jgi:hypothetical protein
MKQLFAVSLFGPLAACGGLKPHDMPLQPGQVAQPLDTFTSDGVLSKKNGH